MKFENMKEAKRIHDRMVMCNKNIEIINNWLEEYPEGNSDGTSTFTENKLYGMHVSEHGDSSGKNHLNLCGSMIQIEVLEFIKKSLQEQFQKDKEYLETL
jgi:hypothetical protein